jgi:hypothetical protein
MTLQLVERGLDLGPLGSSRLLDFFRGRAVDHEFELTGRGPSPSLAVELEEGLDVAEPGADGLGAQDQLRGVF